MNMKEKLINKYILQMLLSSSEVLSDVTEPSEVCPRKSDKVCMLIFSNFLGQGFLPLGQKMPIRISEEEMGCVIQCVMQVIRMSDSLVREDYVVGEAGQHLQRRNQCVQPWLKMAVNLEPA